MNLKRLVPGVVLAAFVALNVEVFLKDGATEWLRLGLTSWSVGLLLTDLCIALSLVVGWMIVDARKRGATVWPFAVLTVLLGSVGPLLYLVIRSASKGRANDGEQRTPGGLRLERDQPLS